MSRIGKGVKGGVILIRPVLVGCCLQSAFCCSLQAQQESKAHTEHTHTQNTHTQSTHIHDDSKTTVSHVYLRLCSLKNRLQLAGAKPKTVQTSARGVGCVSQWNWRSDAGRGKMGAAGRWLRRLAYSCAISRLTKHIIFAHFYGNEWIVECFA